MKEKFIEKAFLNSFTEGIDYEVVSMSLINDDGKEYSLDELIGRSSQEFFVQHNITENFYENTVLTLGSEYSELFPTPSPKGALFYLTSEEVNIDNAITFGLGVVKFLKGDLKGEYMLFNASLYEDETMSERELAEANSLDEMLMLAMYFQYTFPDKCDDKKLEVLLESKEDYVWTLIHKDRDKVIARLREIFDSKKGGNNIIQFPLKRVN